MTFTKKYAINAPQLCANVPKEDKTVLLFIVTLTFFSIICYSIFLVNTTFNDLQYSLSMLEEVTSDER